MNYLILIIFSLVLLLLCCFISFLSGFLFATVKGIPFRQKEPPELTKQEKIKLEKQKKEYENFLSFDGSEQK